ncbi:MAG TPA: glycerophosphodiester phosphodiesterase [Longimicrobiales bacterium]|nr:glycerophosphodiester phosphodiesterase [Longimicrobiales bacterium]
MSRHSVLAGAPLLIAHRGGSGLAPENTIPAFVNGAERWAADMIELDVRASADGRCVIMHDELVDRTTNGTGAVAAMPLAQLRELDAGYRFTPDGGATFPFRGAGVRIPTIEEVLEALPAMRITVEVKSGDAQAPLFDAIRRFNARDRVIAAGMFDRERWLFGTYDGAVSGSLEELKPFWMRHRMGLGWVKAPPCDVVQIPEVWNGRRLVTPRLARDLRRHGIPLHVWTVNDPADMHRLLDWGIAGLISDRPDILGRVLHERVGRPLAPAQRETT